MDDSLVMLDSILGIYTVRPDGSNLHEIPEGPSPFRASFGAAQSPDISPDGSRIVYSTLRYTDCRRYESWKYQLATSRLDGMDHKRLGTEESVHSPTWSPDGSRIAFMSRSSEHVSAAYYGWFSRIYTMASDGSDVRHIADGGRSGYIQYVNTKPEWSYDGRYLAFRDFDAELDQSGRYGPVRYSITTVRTDGSEFRRIFESESWVGEPAWSPVGRHIAFLASEDDSTVLYTIEVDGSDRRQVFTASKLPEAAIDYPLSLRVVSWSPDGSEIRFLAYAPNLGLRSIRADGTGFRTLQDSIDADSVGWSRSGSRIAVHRAPQGEESVVLYTSAPDGSDRRDLVRYVHGGLAAENSG